MNDSPCRPNQNKKNKTFYTPAPCHAPTNQTKRAARDEAGWQIKKRPPVVLLKRGITPPAKSKRGLVPKQFRKSKSHPRHKAREDTLLVCTREIGAQSKQNRRDDEANQQCLLWSQNRHGIIPQSLSRVPPDRSSNGP